MIPFICFVLTALTSPFKSKSRLEAENAMLRHQLIVLWRRLHGRVRLTNHDRWFFIQMYRWFPSILTVVTIVRPETLVRWHRAGFRRYWRWKSNSRGGRPRIELELRALIRLMSTENQLWGAPRIHGDLLKLVFSVAQSTVAKYLVKRRGPPSQGWRTFLRNHAPDIAAMDLFVVPTIGFKLLYGFVIVRIDRSSIPGEKRSFWRQQAALQRPLRWRTIPLGLGAGNGRTAPLLGQGATDGISRKAFHRDSGHRLPVEVVRRWHGRLDEIRQSTAREARRRAERIQIIHFSATGLI